MNSSLNFDSLVFFGDSLTDAGDFFNLSSKILVVPIPIESLGYAQRFSNGEVYAEVVPELLNIKDVNNFALGGARALGELKLSTLSSADENFANLLLPDIDPAVLEETLALDININAQVNRFLEEGVKDNTAASLLIGLNDFGQFVPTSPEAAVAEASKLASDIATSTLSSASKLVDAGVDTIILNTLPVGSFFPLNRLQGISDDIPFETHNELLRTGGAELSAEGVNVIMVDFAAIAGEIVADPNSFGFLAPLSTVRFLSLGSSPTILNTPNGPVPSFPEDPTSFSNLDQQVFFDLIHPTTATHGIFAAFYSESLTNNVQIFGSDNDTIEGSEAEDLVLAGSGDDFISLKGGDDVALSGLGNDTVRGEAGNDILSLGSGDDHGFGEDGDDILAGGLGNDTLNGGSDDDVLIGGLGSNNLLGEDGNDVFVFSESSLIGGTDTGTSNVFDGGKGKDTLFLSLTDKTRELIAAADDIRTALNGIGIFTNGIEEIQFIASPADLVTTMETNPLIIEADLWGII